MSVLVGFGCVAVALASVGLLYQWWRDHRYKARVQRRKRRIGYQRAWTWLMRPRAVRLTDQRNKSD